MSQKELVSMVIAKFEIIESWQQADEESSYQVEQLLEGLKSSH